MDLTKIRNMGFAAHIDAGKTTVTERILFYTGVTHKLGDVDEGTATTDWMIQEKERGVSITAASVTVYWKGYRINIIDTPGHVDFTAEVERSLRILDGLVLIFSGVEGVEPQSETIWHQAERYKVPRIAFINKLDRIGADPYRVLKMIREMLGKEPLLLQLPIGLENEFKGVIDLVNLQSYIWEGDETGAKYKIEKISVDKVQQAYEELISKLSDIDEGVMDEYLEKGVVKPERLKEAIRKGTLEFKFLPVLLGSALKNKGIQPLLDAICDYLPSPVDRGEIKGLNPSTKDILTRKPDNTDKFSAVVFKIQMFKGGEKLYYARVFSGKVRVNQKVWNVNKNKEERITRIYLMKANRHNSLREASAGEIVAFVGLKHTETGDTLSEIGAPILYEGMKFPEPLVSIAIEPKSLKDEKKLEEILKNISLEDPTLIVKRDEESGQFIVTGMGELHLEILVDRLKREFNLPVRTGKPQVSYRETITKKVVKRYKFDREIGGERHKGEVEVEVYPLKEGEGKKVEINIELPSEYEELVRNVVEEVFEAGVLAGYPLIDLGAKILWIKLSEGVTLIGTRLALFYALTEALKEAQPILLEPYVRVEIMVPEQYVGNVVSDIGGRGGELEGIEVYTEKVQKIIAIMPLRKIFGYATILRSLTQGRGTFWMRLAYFKPIEQKGREKSYVQT